MGASKEMFIQEREAQMYEEQNTFNGVDLEALDRMTREQIENLAWNWADKHKPRRNNVNAIYWFSKYLYNWLENQENERKRRQEESWKKSEDWQKKRKEAYKNMDLDSKYLSRRDKQKLKQIM